MLPPRFAQAGLGLASDETRIIRARSQSERVLRWILSAMIFGILVLLIQAVAADAADARINGWRYLTIGVLTALTASSVGGALGLLFGLPIASRVAVIRESGADQTQTTSADWFSDNTSMEQIADWLTKIIVGLTLTQWSSIQFQFNRVSAAVSAAMMAPLAEGGIATFQAAPRTPAGDAVMVGGGVIIGAYAVLGFLLVYIWSRRYLSAELAAGRREQQRQRKEAEDAFLAKAADAGAVQARRKDESAVEVAESAIVAADVLTNPEQVPTQAFEEMIRPDGPPDDPWLGQFGGRATDGRVEVTASVEPLLTHKGHYAVEVIVRGMSLTERWALRSQEARIYLHPTFANSIRVEKFTNTGEIRLPIVCYEAFTLGVHLKDGRLFELDLAEIPGVPEEFKG